MTYFTQNTQALDVAQHMEVADSGHTLCCFKSDAVRAGFELLDQVALILNFPIRHSVLDRQSCCTIDELRVGLVGEAVRERHKQVFDRKGWFRILLDVGTVLVDAPVENFRDVAFSVESFIGFCFVLYQHDTGLR